MSLEVSESNMQCSKLLSAKGLSRQLGERILWRNLTIELVKGDRVGLVAPSGSGKTLLMRNLSLLDPLEQGQLTLHGRAPAEWGLPMWRSLCDLPQSAPYITLWNSETEPTKHFVMG